MQILEAVFQPLILVNRHDSSHHTQPHKKKNDYNNYNLLNIIPEHPCFSTQRSQSDPVQPLSHLK